MVAFPRELDLNLSELLINLFIHQSNLSRENFLNRGKEIQIYYSPNNIIF